MAAGTPQMCAGVASRNVVAGILNNSKGYLGGEAANGAWAMESIYSVLLNPLEMAINCGDVQMLDTMAEIVGGSAATLSTTADGQVWLANGIELRLISAEWIYVLSRVIDGISAVPAAQRTAKMNSVTQTFVPIVAAHAKRWIFNAPSYGMSGCPYTAGSGHLEYLRILQGRSLGGVLSFCNGLTDADLWIMAAGSELLRAASNDPSLVNLAGLGISQADLVAYVRTTAELTRARLIPTSLTRPGGGTAQGFDFEPGVWSDLFADSGWSGYVGTSFPTAPSGAILVPPSKSPMAGWDTGHAGAFVHLVNSLRRLRSITGATFPSDGDMVGLANQVVYGMLIGGDAQWPQFSNYFSGWNGWYRVNYSGRAGFGFGPSDLGNSKVMTGAYGLWAPWNSDLAALNARIGVILQATDSATVNWRTETYAKYWTDFVRSGTPSLNRSTSWFLMQHVAASVGANW